MLRPTFLILAGAMALAGLVQAQPKAQPKAPPPPPLMDCGAHGNLEVLCGTRSPEDLELTPDGKYLIVPQFVTPRGNTPPGAGLTIFDLAAKTYGKLATITEPSLKQGAAWGDSACPGPIGDALVPHGISLLKRKDGAQQLFVVNHGGGRQSIEMYELKPSGANWAVVWRGCVVSKQDFNDVAALADGGFIATHPTALRAQGETSDLFAGQPSGWVARWSAAKGEEELPGTRAAYPNGVLVSADGRTMYFNAWTAKEVHKYDLKQRKETGMVKLDFMPDNITWTSNHQMLAAGVKSARGECPANSGTPCGQTFGVAEIDPAKMTARTVFESGSQPSPISGVSVALQVGNSIYIGAFQGDRLVKTAFKK
jgi:hypothetical protein